MGPILWGLIIAGGLQRKQGVEVLGRCALLCDGCRLTTCLACVGARCGRRPRQQHYTGGSASSVRSRTARLGGVNSRYEQGTNKLHTGLTRAHCASAHGQAHCVPCGRPPQRRPWPQGLRPSKPRLAPPPPGAPAPHAAWRLVRVAVRAEGPALLHSARASSSTLSSRARTLRTLIVTSAVSGSAAVRMASTSAGASVVRQ